MRLTLPQTAPSLRAAFSEKRLHTDLDLPHSGLALELRAHYAIPVDEERQRQSQDTAILLGETFIAQGCRVVQLEPLHEASRRRGVVIH